MNESIAGMLGSAQREKYWNEMDAEHKVEVMRDQIRWQHHTIRRLQREMQSLLNHEHGADGSTLVPIREAHRDEPMSMRQYEVLK